MTTVTVVIPSWNGAQLLPRCLASLRSQSRRADRVLVVDNGSTDGSTEVLERRFPEVEVIRLGSNLGFAAAVNVGIRACDSEFVALLNNDTEAESGWLAALVEAPKGGRIGMVASKIVEAGDPLRVEGIGLEVDAEGNPHQIGKGERDGHEFDEPREVFGPIGAAALYRRELFEEVGLFDEDFVSYLEDVDLAWRARRSGWRCIYAPGAVVRHARAASARRIPRRIRYLLWRNFVWLVAKNAEPRALLRLAIRQPLRDLVEAARLVAAGRAGDVVILAAARVAALFGLPRMLRRRTARTLPSERSGMRPRLSVIVVSRDTRELLARCLRSVAADPAGASAEVWVVDNASTDGSPQMVADLFPAVRLIVNDTNRGFAAACNQALTCAAGRILLLLNSDAAGEPGALDRLCAVLERRSEVGVVSGQLLGPDGRAQRSYGRTPTVRSFLAEMVGAGGVPGIRRLLPGVASAPRLRERARKVGHVCGACMAFRREVLGAVGLLDERFFLYFEETDFCLRVRRDAGLLVWFEAAARIRHEGQATARRLPREAEVHYARSASAFIRKHYGALAARRLAAAFRLWLAAQVLVHRLEALARRPGAVDSISRKRRLMGLHRALGAGDGWGWAS